MNRGSKLPVLVKSPNSYSRGNKLRVAPLRKKLKLSRTRVRAVIRVGMRTARNEKAARGESDTSDYEEEKSV